MTSVSSQQPRMQEQALLNLLKRLERSSSDNFVVQIHLSKLLTYKTQPECLEVVRTMLAREAKKTDASIFAIFNKDIFIVYSRSVLTEVDGALARICQVLGDDPFFASGQAAEQEFCTYYDLDSQMSEVLAQVEDLVQKRAQQEAKARAAKKGTQTKPLNLANLALIEKTIAQADLSAMTSRQPICEVDDSGLPVPLFYELFTSMGVLQKTLLPDQDLFADRWLFQYLTTKLDQRMLAWLSKNDDATLKHSFSVNLNITSVLSPRFLELDALLDKTRRNTIVIELQQIDVFADIARFLFAREFLLDRGYRICLDGITSLALPYVDRQKLGVELLKLQWTPQLRAQLEGKDGERLREAIKTANPRRIILMRCESDDAIEFGHELGISLFQGYFLDHLLSEKITREEAAERLSAALARHRRTAQATHSAAGS